MKSDISRKTFDLRNQYSRVLMQQGRVTVDADFNEQTDILLHYLRALATDLIGPYAAPTEGGGFTLKGDDGDLKISQGRYYVDGILIENEAECSYQNQPWYPTPDDDVLLKAMNDNATKTFWVYLDVWERHITCIEDDVIRERALGGPDTCARSQVVWQVKAKEIEGVSILNLPACDDLPDSPKPVSVVKMSARVDPGFQSDDPCVLSPEARYRGTENHLYRVEIHDSGLATVKGDRATFKWSRDNGSVVSAWLGTTGNDLQVSSGHGFTAGCWVELIDDNKDLLGLPGALVKVAKVEGSTLSIDPSSVRANDALVWNDQLVHPKVRRWDQTQVKNGVVPIVESTATEIKWIDLEDGIQVQFTSGGEYRTGDYWLIPARVAADKGEIEWIAKGGDRQPPHGIEHHYAPLGFVTWTGIKFQIDKSCRCEFEPIRNCELENNRSVPAPRSSALTPGVAPIQHAKRKPTRRQADG